MFALATIETVTSTGTTVKDADDNGWLDSDIANI